MSADTGLTPVPSQGGRHRARQRVELPESVMRCIAALAGDATLSPGERLSGVLMLIYGWAWYDRQESIDPGAIALPQHQWLEICGRLAQGVADDAVAAVNLGLSFMNSGPSCFETEGIDSENACAVTAVTRPAQKLWAQGRRGPCCALRQAWQGPGTFEVTANGRCHAVGQFASTVPGGQVAIADIGATAVVTGTFLGEGLAAWDVCSIEWHAGGVPAGRGPYIYSFGSGSTCGPPRRPPLCATSRQVERDRRGSDFITSTVRAVARA